MTLRLLARNSATDSENRIHADEVARQYGFRGGLVPGVTVFGYLMRALPEWPQSLQVRLLKPVFDGDELEIRSAGSEVTASRGEELCGSLTRGDFQHDFQSTPEAALPFERPEANQGTLVPGTVLGTLRKQLQEVDPESLLNLANRALLENFVLNPWLHVSSEITSHGPASPHDEITVRSRIHDRFDKKGREFVVLDVALSQASQPLLSIRHTAIYSLG